MGLSLYETVELRRGRPFALRRHLDRLLASSARLELPAPDRTTLSDAAAHVAATWGTRPGRLRLTVRHDDGGAPRVTMQAARMVVQTEPVDVVVADGVHDERGPTSGLKTSKCADQVAALRRAVALGAGEAVFANTRGELCEGTTSNVLVRIDDTWCTPALRSGCLPGITRALLLEAAAGTPFELAERTITMDELAGATEVALVSTGRHVQPVRSIGGRTLPHVEGASTRGLRTLFREAYGDTPDP